MLVHCTSKAANFLGLTPPAAPASYDAFHSWRLNMLERNGKPIAVLMNESNRFCVAVAELPPENLEAFEKRFLYALHDILMSEWVNPELVDSYIDSLGSFSYCKNTGKPITAWLARTCKSVNAAMQIFREPCQISQYANSEFLAGDFTDSSFNPKNRMLEDLKRYNLPIKKSMAYRILAKMRTPSHMEVNEFLLPAAYLFSQLSQIFEDTFQMKLSVTDYDFHLSRSNDGSPDMDLTDDDEKLKQGATAAEDIRLYQALSTYRNFAYRGSGTQITCEVLEMISDCEEDIPQVISKGRTPKGAPGYLFEGDDEYYEFRDEIDL
ncbi:MAG: hypothetical protein LBC41_02160 [Clostridiales bacterium]|jgi:hypothetical protein|nr:hypothetical protein [Clostridiales bacterium]MDR2749439.1 hypothetical protein [Clostridiales bacterium]